MKKILILLSALLVLGACNKKEVESPLNVRYTFDITVNSGSNQTKAVKTGWESGDVVYVFFDNVAAPKYLKMSYNGSEWSKVMYNGDTPEDFEISGDGKMTAVYLPFGNDEVVSADGTSFKFSKTYTSYFLKAEKVPFKLDGSTVRGTLDMTVPEEFVQISLTIPDGGWEQLTTPNEWPEENHGVAYITSSDSTVSYYAVSFISVTSDGTIDMSKVKNGDIYGYLYKGDLTFSFLLDETNFLDLSWHQLTFYLKAGDGYWIGAGAVWFPGWAYRPADGSLSPGESVTIDANKLSVGYV